jgi:glycosyltransferase involved in cell wall biosynthesis
MKVAIDVSPIIYGTGVSNYRHNLVKNLIKFVPDNEYLLYGGSLRRFTELEERIKSYGSSLTKVFPIPPRFADILWNKLHILPIEKLIGECDLIHTSDWSEPPSKVNKVTTIHDLVPLVLPKFTPKIIVETHKQRLNWVEKESRIIIAPSIATKDDMIKLGFDEAKIRVIYEAPNFTKASESSVAAVKRKYSIHDEYIIMIGTNPRKNIERSINAYHLAKHGKNIKLLIVGEKKGLKISDERGVRFLGFVPTEDLSPLLTGSKLLLFPSLYEGFGVPILEGYLCEVPVVTSNISSMPEAAGGASILVDPYDTNSIADGIEEALSKPKTLISKGLKVASSYSWQTNAIETAKVYKEASEK